MTAYNSKQDADHTGSETRQTLSTAADTNIPPTAATKYRSWGGEMFNPRQESTEPKLTDIIAFVVTEVVPSSTPDAQEPPHHGVMGKFFKKERPEKKDGQTNTKTIFLPRSEYLKWFAIDENGSYIGTEPKRTWTEDELDEKFGQYRPRKNEKRDVGFIDRFFNANARGL